MSFAAGQEKGDLIPSSPESLLRILPSELPRWELTRSEAKSYAARGFFSQAMREYTEVLPPDVKARTQTPLKMLIQIRDTAENETQLGPFRMTPEQLQASPFKRGEWKGAPLLMMNDGDAERTSARILLRGRWILQIVFPNRDFGAAQRWLEQVDLEGVSRLSYVRYSEAPDVIPIQQIDELNSARSRKYWLSVNRAADIEAATERIREEYRALGWEMEGEGQGDAPSPESGPPPGELQDAGET